MEVINIFYNEDTRADDCIYGGRDAEDFKGSIDCKPTDVIGITALQALLVGYSV